MSLAHAYPEAASIDRLTRALERLTAQLAKPRPRRLSRFEQLRRAHESIAETMQ